MNLRSLFFLFSLIVLSTAQGQEHHFEHFSSYAGLTSLNGGHGAVVGDFDGDGWEDVFIPGQGQGNLLLKNMGDSTFQNVIFGSGIVSGGFSYTAVWADIDNDDDLDLFVGNFANTFFNFSNYLYLNEGDGQFTDITFEAGVNSFDGTRSILATDIDSDGFTDFYVCNSNGQNVMWKNNGDLTFTNVTISSGTSDPLISMGAIFFDYDNDGDQDLYITHDNFQANILYQNDGTGSFINLSAASGLNRVSMGMRVDVADIGHDGWLDIYITNLGPNSLFINNQDGTFTEVGESAGVGDTGMGWGCFFLDHDNDSDQDIYLVNQYNFTPLPNRLYDNDGLGNYTDIAPGTLLRSTNNGFGGTWFDMDNNGYQDIIIANIGDTLVELFLNDTQANHWVSFTLKGTVSARDAFGTRVELFVDGQRFIDEKTSASSYSAQSSHRVHFGLAGYEMVDSVHFTFPSGIVNVLYDLPADRLYSVVEDTSSQVISCLPDASFEWMSLGQNQVQVQWTNVEEVNNWSFSSDDGTILLDTSGVFTFSEAGEYEICLTVENACSFNSFCQTVEAICDLPSVSFSYTTDILQVEVEGQATLFDSLLWSFGDGSLSTDLLTSYTYTEEGAYELCLTAYNGCGEVTVCDSVSVFDLVNSNVSFERNYDISIYPNPTSDFVYVTGISDPILSISLETLDGRNCSLNCIKENGVLALEGLATLPEGVYLLRIQTSAGYMTKRLLINR
ncbi:MAG: FG-GAP-like repeat-containing protein [Bacteroidetes bacterium]|nr:FG-GAP-like repeat-containing protein [Bacteroidota bacterium]